MTKIATKEKKLLNMGEEKKSKGFFCQKSKKKVLTKGQSLPQDQEEGPCSGQYLLFLFI